MLALPPKELPSIAFAAESAVVVAVEDNGVDEAPWVTHYAFLYCEFGEIETRMEGGRKFGYSLGIIDFKFFSFNFTFIYLDTHMRVNIGM